MTEKTTIYDKQGYIASKYSKSITDIIDAIDRADFDKTYDTHFICQSDHVADIVKLLHSMRADIRHYNCKFYGDCDDYCYISISFHSEFWDKYRYIKKELPDNIIGQFACLCE